LSDVVEVRVVIVVLLLREHRLEDVELAREVIAGVGRIGGLAQRLLLHRLEAEGHHA
jgi:hypothetical protein